MTEVPPVTPVTGCEAVASEISKYGEWDQQTMVAIAKAENRACDPFGHNLSAGENHGVCIGSYGVLQVGCVHYNGEDVNDLAINVSIAHEVWRKQGYNAWTQYTNGTYKEFLK